MTLFNYIFIIHKMKYSFILTEFNIKVNSLLKNKNFKLRCEMEILSFKQLMLVKTEWESNPSTN